MTDQEILRLVEAGRFFVLSGTNTYTATSAATLPPVQSYSLRKSFYFKTTNGSTGASTINIDSVSAVSLVKLGGVPIASGDFSANGIIEAVYDGTNFQVISGITQSFASLTGKPTTLSGYGITDNITIQGNTFNGASQLVQLTAAGKYPALDGSLITGLASSPVSSVFGRTGAVVAVAGDYGPTLGGTGLTSYTIGDIIYASATNVLSKLAAGTGGYVLTLASGVPAWAASSSVSLSGNNTWTGNNLFNKGGGSLGGMYTADFTIAPTADGSPSLYLNQYGNGNVGFSFVVTTGGTFQICSAVSGTVTPLVTFSRTGNPTIFNTGFAIDNLISFTGSTSNRIYLRNLPQFCLGWDASDDIVKLSTLNDGYARYVALGGTVSSTFVSVLAVSPKNNSVGIGILSANASAILDITSTTKGLLPPRMSTSQKGTISAPAAGLIVYDTTLNKLCLYTGSAWETITSS